MIVVSNTSPLNYLVLIQSVDVLHELFGSVVIPRAVATELSDSATPEPVRSWIANPPDWLDIRIPSTQDVGLQLHPGERDALSLALEFDASLILVDDLVARRVARELGLSVTGTVGVLDRAAERGLIDLPATVEALRRTSYRIREEVLDSLLENHERRQGRRGDSDPGASRDV